METIKLNNGLTCPVIGIAKLNKGKRYYTRAAEALAGFAGWQPTYEAE